ncbi:unnamed protein product (macronuclear) [Paramecium tetraurelia]|uniref:Uncharacterized protein n=1 Tax=Paramecium tetraurelia TaxID=5888 RepID=A0C8H0_PARTE|nr:uncharacterized protein GSPATT00036220001 [Paramecium tetraurelia]CAK67087.1 unnamed protein product [Paramecium tetraurelia]|eukprot:XP_001434484.1 hypothetical protein (macronuclear) [Paramecium tetraurelia strain d4-2]
MLPFYLALTSRMHTNQPQQAWFLWQYSEIHHSPNHNIWHSALHRKSGICCGKYINEFLGVKVIDCDQIARDNVQPGKPAYKLIVQRFGLSILPIDAQKLAEVEFQDGQLRKQLQTITNKFILKEITKFILKICFFQEDQFVIVYAPLLFEIKALEYFFFLIITVTVTNPEEIIKRQIYIVMVNQQKKSYY